jgi:hypothetical protein
MPDARHGKDIGCRLRFDLNAIGGDNRDRTVLLAGGESSDAKKRRQNISKPNTFMTGRLPGDAQNGQTDR